MIAIDRVPERLKLANEKGSAEVINFEQSDVYSKLLEMTDGRGPDCAIDCVGAEAYAKFNAKQDGCIKVVMTP